MNSVDQSAISQSTETLFTLIPNLLLHQSHVHRPNESSPGARSGFGADGVAIGTTR